MIGVAIRPLRSAPKWVRGCPLSQNQPGEPLTETSLVTTSVACNAYIAKRRGFRTV